MQLFGAELCSEADDFIRLTERGSFLKKVWYTDLRVKVTQMRRNEEDANMEFQNLIEKRRTIRKYAEGNMVSKEDIFAMIKAAQEAPSWKNSQTGRYYCIMNEKDVEQFRRECLPEMNAGKCENAVLLVSTFVHNRAGFQKDGTADNELGNGWGCYDLGLQNENLILKAEELGYGTLIMGIRDADKIREFCSVPETETVVAVIAVGVPGEEPGRPKRKDTEEIVKFL